MDPINVRVCEAGGAFVNVPMTASATVEQVLRAAGVDSATAKQVRLNDAPATLTDVVHDGDTLYIVPAIKGNK